MPSIRPRSARIAPAFRNGHGEGGRGKLLLDGRASRRDEEVLAGRRATSRSRLTDTSGATRSIRPNAPRPARTRCMCSRPAPRRRASSLSTRGTPGSGLTCSGRSSRAWTAPRRGGKVEIDFQNSVLDDENKPTIMLRHAYAEAKNEDFRILVGQTWDVISPLNPDMLLYSVGWDGGNIGYRRAQFRYERYLKFSDVSLVTVQSSINQDVFPDTHHRRPRASRRTGRSSRDASPGPSATAAKAVCRSPSACRATSAKTSSTARSSAATTDAAPGRATSTSACLDRTVGIRGRMFHRRKPQPVPRRHRPGDRPDHRQHDPRRRRLV